MDIDYILQTFDQIEDTILRLRENNYAAGSMSMLLEWIDTCKQKYVQYEKEGDSQHIELVFYVCILLDKIKQEEERRCIPAMILPLWNDFSRVLPHFLKHLAYPKTCTLPDGVLSIVRKYVGKGKLIT